VATVAPVGVEAAVGTLRATAYTVPRLLLPAADRAVRVGCRPLHVAQVLQLARRSGRSGSGLAAAELARQRR